ncbi:TIGR01741 family protein, partial [Staphylococcus aureus]|uniref:TIGR01741 family protein n=1 Tax=Staphylococcus aureus TaxID=1280 RepID=UPI0015E8E1DC
MTFEEKLSQMYNEIANKISSMIPVEWEKVYTMAYIDDEGGEVFYYYTEPGLSLMHLGRCRPIPMITSRRT